MNDDTVDPGERLLDVKDIAERLKIAPKTVRDMSADGRLFRPIYIGRLARWRARDIEQWIEQRAAAAAKISAAARKAGKHSRV